MIRRSILAAAIAAFCSAGAQAADFSATYFFGDSLSDAGSFSAFLPSGTGRFTTNPGPVWAEDLAAALGTRAVPALAGGTDFAQGGARVTQLPGVPETNILTANATPIADQVAGYLALAGHARSNALYSVWGGANDLFRAIDPTKPESADPVGYMLTTAGETVATVSALKAAGARYILVPTLPDVGATPFGGSLDPASAAGVSALSSLYNQAVFGGLAAGGVRVIPLDIFSLLNEAIASPAQFGFVNVTLPACGATPALLCAQADLIAPGADQTFLFADGVHPTTAGHRIIADYALSVLRAPGVISQLAESPVHTREMLVTTIGDQAALGLWSRTQPGFGAWASLGASHLKQASSDSAPGADGNPYDVTVGIDTHLSSNMVVGAAFGAGSLDADFSGDAGSYRQDEQTLALYAGYRSGPLRATVVAAAGDIDFDTRRAADLGPARHVMKGDTSGTSLSFGAEASYDLSEGKLRHGPLLGADWQQVRVESFRERGNTSTTMAFGSQQRDSLVGRIGYQLRYEQGRCQPYARIAFNHEFADQDRDVRASLATLPDNSFALPAFAAERNYGTATVGVAAKFSPTVSANVALTGRFAPDDVTWYGLQAGIQIAF
ncbi:MAG TPA: autotransporter domain-containing protein [Aromatoleum sp.]|uniref:autotransporter domain-containing protein n=1 Tax=Aromatoleum sp. TaxID=2307007 RepID=UPI002B493872|nr:autotransporter domain-containing protein [Aromatoleum sp.]HJV26504.1 autotransporter domain-containing protein [Aromatoleum sp.]